MNMHLNDKLFLLNYQLIKNMQIHVSANINKYSHRENVILSMICYISMIWYQFYDNSFIKFVYIYYIIKLILILKYYNLNYLLLHIRNKHKC